MKLVWAGVRREKGVAQAHKKPALTKHIRSMVEHLPTTTLGVRDRALILLGFAGAMRRSELVGLDVADVATTDDGLVVAIRRSKTDQAGAGREFGIPFGEHAGTCSVRAALAWIDEAETGVRARGDRGPGRSGRSSGSAAVPCGELWDGPHRVAILAWAAAVRRKVAAPRVW